MKEPTKYIRKFLNPNPKLKTKKYSYIVDIEPYKGMYRVSLLTYGSKGKDKGYYGKPVDYDYYPSETLATKDELLKFYNFDIDNYIIKEKSMKKRRIKEDIFAKRYYEDRQAMRIRRRRSKNRKFRESYDYYISEEILPIVTEILEDKKDILRDYEFYNDDGTVETTDGSSRDGFISNTEGTASFYGFAFARHMEGSGYLPSDKKVRKAIEEYLDDNHEYAQESIFKKYKNELIQAGFEDEKSLNYHDLYDADLEDIAEELDEKESYFDEDPCGFTVNVYFRENRDETFNCYVFSEVFIADPYMRKGSGIEVYSGEFDFDRDVDLKVFTKLVEKHIIKAFESME